jgi:hypothetical protein
MQHPAVEGWGVPHVPSRWLLWGALGISRLHRSGVLPQRVLVVGSRSLLRRPAFRRALPQLTEDLADRIWLSTRRGLDVDVVWELRHLLRAVLRGLAALRLSRYDVVVLLAAPEPTGGPGARTRRLARAILREMSPSARFLAVTLADSPEAGGRPSDMPAAAGDGGAVARLEPLEVPPLRAVLGPGRTAAEAIVRRLQIPRLLGGPRRNEEQDAGDAGRDEAAEALELQGRPDDARLERLVEMACDAFATPFAEVNIVGRDAQWSVAAAGLPRGTRSREKSLCELAIRNSAPTVIRDTLRELPVERIPRLGNGRLVRFYAGYPIQSIDGHRVGVLCVYDTRPHHVEESRLSTLRDLALLAEERLVGV